MAIRAELLKIRGSSCNQLRSKILKLFTSEGDTNNLKLNHYFNNKDTYIK